MGDFSQSGMITTLQILSQQPIEKIERELEKIAVKRKMALLLPALITEFDGPAMPVIIEELKKVPYLDKIVLSLDKADAKKFQKVRKIMSRLPTEVKIVWHDGPRIKALMKEMHEADFDLGSPGKGRSVWMSIGYILSYRDIYAMALHDCDVLNYKRDMVARLFYPVVHPAIDFEFSKGYYARVTNKLYGRVTRLFYTPLIRTLKRILGFHPFIEYLGNFRYALSGEFAFVASLAKGVRISPTWGLEVSMLSEVYQMTSANRICQVEIIDLYEHKHQTLDKEKPNAGLIRMATDIAKVLFRVLSQDGLVMSSSFFRTLRTSYTQESRVVIGKYHALALLNGLTYDRHEEIVAVDAFVNSLQLAVEEFMADPVGIPMLSGWTRIAAAIPDFSERLNEAVEQDNK